jgi:hypothetical protein
MLLLQQTNQALLLKEQLRLHAQWRARGTRAVHDLRTWLRNNGRSGAEIDTLLAHAIDAINSERLSIAVTGDGQRGKSELINALFFADYGRRLLPVSGSHSLCTTEIFWDRGTNESYLRLLPIETCGEDETVAALKKQPDRWVRFPLRPQEPEQMRTVLEEIHQSKSLSQTQAARLGLLDLETKNGAKIDRVEVPRWRHALISLPHPMLKKGLVVFDMPGLDALDRDPEPARTILQEAQALVFAVSAECGVQRSDLALWQQYLHGFRGDRRNSVLVVLTKTDLIAKGLHGGDSDASDEIERQRRLVSRALGANSAMVLAASARDGLASKIADKRARRQASGIDRVEALLSERLIKNKRERCREIIDSSISTLLEGGISDLSERIPGIKRRIESLTEALAKTRNLMERIRARTRGDQERYLRAVELFQSARKDLLDSALRCRRLLQSDHFELVVSSAHMKMTQSWTSIGVQQAMQALFGELRHIVAQTSSDSEQLHRRMQQVYARMNKQMGTSITMPSVFVATLYRSEMERLHAEARAFRNGPGMLLAERGAAIARFDRRLVEPARILLEQLRGAWDDWIRACMQPLASEIERFKQTTEQRLDRLQQIQSSRDETERQVAALRRHHMQLAKQMILLRNIRNTLNNEPSPRPKQQRGPYLVARDGKPVEMSKDQPAGPTAA